MALPAVPLPGYEKPGSADLLCVEGAYAWYTAERYPPGKDGHEIIERVFLAQLKAPASACLGKRVKLQVVVVPRKKGVPPLDDGAQFPFELRLVDELASSSLVVAVLVYQGMAGDGAMMRVCGWIQAGKLKNSGERRAVCVAYPASGLLKRTETATVLLEERKRKAPVELEEEIEEVDDREFERKRNRTLGANITPLLYLSTAADSPEDFRYASRMRTSQFGDKAFRERVLSCTVLRMRALLALHEGKPSAGGLVDAVEALSPDDDYASAACLAAMCFTCDATADRKRWLARSEETLLRLRFSRSSHFFSSYAKLEVMLKRNRVLIFERRGPDSYGLVFKEQDPSLGELKGAALRAVRYPLVVRVDMQADETAHTREHAVRMAWLGHTVKPPLTSPWVKVPFHAAGKYLAEASVHVEGGWAYLSVGLMLEVLVRWRLSVLEDLLERRFWNTDVGAAIAKAYPGLRSLCRDVVNAAPRARRAKKTADDIELPDIEDAMVRVMPLCVTNLHQRLSKGSHRLQYWERLQLARTLGACGYTSSEVYVYMSTHASKAADYDRAKDREIEKLTQDMDKAKETSHSSDHLYDLEDRSERREHAALEGYACNTYIRMEIKPDNHNGCPFAPYFDAKELERMLSESGQLLPEQIKQILAERKADPKRACNSHLVYKAVGAVGASEEEVRKSMRETRFYVNRPKQFASYLAKLTEPEA